MGVIRADERKAFVNTRRLIVAYPHDAQLDHFPAADNSPMNSRIASAWQCMRGRSSGARPGGGKRCRTPSNSLTAIAG